MKRKIKKMAAVILSLSMAIMIFLPSTPVFAGQMVYNNETGIHGGYNYELWKDYGNTVMELNDGGTFSCQWSNIGNALFRKGRKFNSDKSHQEIGEITVEYGCQYNPQGNSYLCVYGWDKVSAGRIIHRRKLGQLAATRSNTQGNHHSGWRYL